MNRIINDRAGASIALALFYLIICAVLTTIILTVGSVSASKSLKQKNVEEINLLVLSLFKSFNQEIGGKEIEYDLSTGEEMLRSSLKIQDVELLNELMSQAYVYLYEVGETYSNIFEVNIDDVNYKCEFIFYGTDCSIKINVSEIVKDDEVYKNISPCSIIFNSNRINKNLSNKFVKVKYDKGVINW